MTFDDIEIIPGVDAEESIDACSVVRAFLANLDESDSDSIFGVHRVVRHSLFDPQHRRHTSFVLVKQKDDEARWNDQAVSHILCPYFLVKNIKTGKIYGESKEVYGKFWEDRFYGYHQR